MKLTDREILAVCLRHNLSIPMPLQAGPLLELPDEALVDALRAAALSLIARGWEVDDAGELIVPDDVMRAVRAMAEPVAAAQTDVGTTGHLTRTTYATGDGGFARVCEVHQGIYDIDWFDRALTADDIALPPAPSAAPGVDGARHCLYDDLNAYMTDPSSEGALVVANELGVGGGVMAITAATADGAFSTQSGWIDAPTGLWLIAPSSDVEVELRPASPSEATTAVERSVSGFVDALA